MFHEIQLRVDNNHYSSRTNLLKTDYKELYFYYTDNNETVEIQLILKNTYSDLKLIPSRDFEIVDTLIKIGKIYKTKLKFYDLTSVEYLKLVFSAVKDSKEYIEEIPLQPLFLTSASIRPIDDALYIGEEKSYEVFSNNINNLLISNEWVTKNDYEYRYTKQEEKVYLNIIPKVTGSIRVEVPISVRIPYINEQKQVTHKLSPLLHTFLVKSVRLRYLHTDKNDITLDEKTRMEGELVQLENFRTLKLNKTYRIEGQERKGGALIAEIFTKSRMSNNNVLCVLRPYNYHRQSDGYLYIKDGDNAEFITNFNITPATKIERIKILQEGKDWKTTTKVFPGETVDLRIEGQGLHKADFHFEDLVDISRDTLIRNENEQVFKLQIPNDISKKRLKVYNHNTPTGWNLSVEEFQRPREFDYIMLNYGDLSRQVSSIRGNILYEKTIKDVTLDFNPTRIDNDLYYGKQYLEIDVKLTDRKNNLIEMRTIKNIAVCPSKYSPRYKYYNTNDCISDNISLNKYLRKKTYDLDQWSHINLAIRNADSKYKEEGHEKELEIILKRDYSFDIEVSFPAGLITITARDTGEAEIGSLSGISMAMIAQFSFYHPDKIAKYRPYKIGAGFLALNAFNFSEKANRDVGLVVIGSLYPTRKDLKLAFPLYIGGGYFIQEKKLFFLIGPGIRIRL